MNENELRKFAEAIEAESGVLPETIAMIDAAGEITKLREQVAAQAAVIESLWQIIDDIDTYGDMAKSDDVLFRSLVERRQKDRWKTGITTDGYTLAIPTDSTQILDEVRRAEREKCAKVCEELRHPDGYSGENVDWCAGTDHCAKFIRAME